MAAMPSHHAARILYLSVHNQTRGRNEISAITRVTHRVLPGVVRFGVTTGEFVIAGILPDVADNLDVSIPAAGLLVTAYAIGMIIGGPALTALTARFARKPLIVVLLVVVVVGNLA